ncbi:hypothetical protein E3N88_12736 [Mikania micrantha]|uniref:Uncharacterized protein n=1 Tax=Mikania micrantha TaxID=192012 RepID=A0A5N6P8X7_9ASTR|nr:hypothetical protein E3N88_12736 [Mikania micrantha]
MSALGRPQDMFSDTAIQLQPVFAQWIQNTHALAPGATASTSLTWGGGDLVAVGGKVALLPIPLGTADFLSDVWGSISDQGVVTHITGGNFAQSSITINGWLRDFLWAQASQYSSMSLILGRVIGDIVDQFTPSVAMDVTYTPDQPVSNGQELMPNLIASKPHVNVGGVDMRSSYTIIMTDPDAPSPSDPYLKEYLHW